MGKLGDSRGRVTPLTHPDPQRPGNPYQRLAPVEEQIADLLKLDEQSLTARSRVLDFTAPEYIRSECLVYFLREALRTSNDDLVNTLTTALSRRCAKHINDRIQRLIDRRYVDDCFNDAVAAVFVPILDITSDRADFAQVRFGIFLQYGVSNIIRDYLKRQKEDRVTESLDTEIKESDKAPLPAALQASAEGIFNQAAFNEMLSTLGEPHRTAFLMRHIGGREIENKDPKVYTISKHFGRSPKTIRRWLAEAEEQLRLRQGD